MSERVSEKTASSFLSFLRKCNSIIESSSNYNSDGNENVTKGRFSLATESVSES